MVELLVVLAIVSVLISGLLIFINPVKQLQKAKDSQRQGDLSNTRSALDTYYNDNNCFPTSLSFGSVLQHGNEIYMKKVPQDPDCAGGGSCYQYITDNASSCPQWAVLFSKAQANGSAVSCPLNSYASICIPTNYYSSGYSSCVVTGILNCAVLGTKIIPTSGGSQTVPTPTPGGGSGGSYPTNTPTPTLAPQPTPTPTHAPTATPTPTPTSAPVSTPTPTPGCGSTLQARIDAAVAGATIDATGCTYHETATINKALTLKNGTITGDNTRTYGIVVGANNVTIDGTTVQDTNSPLQDGSVRVRNSSNFTFKNGKILRGDGSCISIAGGSNHLVTNSELAYCGQQGYHTTGVTNITYSNDHIHNNNPNNAVDSEWEAGGGKVTNSSGVTFSGNEVNDNFGPGIWCDINCTNATITGNDVYNNDKAGIMYEISTTGTITGNSVWNNGFGKADWGWGAGILLSSSASTEVSGNTVAWNADGISVVSQSRSDKPSGSGTGLYVHDNNIILQPMSSDTSDKMLLAWLEDWSGPMYNSGSNNRGVQNKYWHSVADPSYCRFQWSGCVNSLSSFNATSGEEGGAYLSTTTRNNALNAAGIPTTAPSH